VTVCSVRKYFSKIYDILFLVFLQLVHKRSHLQKRRLQSQALWLRRTGESNFIATSKNTFNFAFMLIIRTRKSELAISRFSNLKLFLSHSIFRSFIFPPSLFSLHHCLLSSAVCLDFSLYVIPWM
jgi:hypothetical protein